MKSSEGSVKLHEEEAGLILIQSSVSDVVLMQRESLLGTRAGLGLSACGFRMFTSSNITRGERTLSQG